METIVTKQSKVKCPWCEEVHEAEIWNDETYNECKSREMKRAFKSIYNIQVWGKKSQHFYKCPRCAMWSNGNQLELIDDNGEAISGVGGQPVVKLM